MQTLSYKELYELPNPPKFIVKETKNDLYFRYPNKGTYNLPKKDFDDPTTALKWIEHLVGKNWVTKDDIYELIQYIRSPKSKIKLN